MRRCQQTTVFLMGEEVGEYQGAYKFGWQLCVWEFLHLLLTILHIFLFQQSDVTNSSIVYDCRYPRVFSRNMVLIEFSILQLQRLDLQGLVLVQLTMVFSLL
ncbi:unnamed protein product [Musa acuminata subsp. burmannicoides]